MVEMILSSGKKITSIKDLKTNDEIIEFVTRIHGYCKVTEKICITSECKRDWKNCDSRIGLI